MKARTRSRFIRAIEDAWRTAPTYSGAPQCLIDQMNDYDLDVIDKRTQSAVLTEEYERMKHLLLEIQQDPVAMAAARLRKSIPRDDMSSE